MIKDIVSYLENEFTDYKGEVHKITVCAVSQGIVKDDDGYQLMVGWVNPDEYDIDETQDIYDSVFRAVSLGIAIQNPCDKQNPEIGKSIALNRAKKANPCLYSTRPGVINTLVVNGLMLQESSFVKDHPEKFIKGYSETKERWEKRQAILKEEKELKPEERIVVEALLADVDLEKCMRVASIC